jgi:hypothetical protein
MYRYLTFPWKIICSRYFSKRWDVASEVKVYPDRIDLADARFVAELLPAW